MTEIVEKITTNKWWYLFATVSAILVIVALVAKFGNWKIPLLHDVKEMVVD